MATATVGISETALGKELAKIIPPECRRVIIDIPHDGCVMVYYECFASKKLLQLDWTNALADAEVINVEEKEK